MVNPDKKRSPLLSRSKVYFRLRERPVVGQNGGTYGVRAVDYGHVESSENGLTRHAQTASMLRGSLCEAAMPCSPGGNRSSFVEVRAASNFMVRMAAGSK
jgi:hypothetical protein